MVKAVLFDLDGVIRIWDWELLERSEKEARLPPGAIPEAAFSPDLLEPVVTGKVTDEDWRRQVAGRLREQYPDADGDLAMQLWSASVGRVDEGVLALVRACRQSCKVLLISNASSRLRRDLSVLGIIDDFDGIINTWKRPVLWGSEATTTSGSHP